MLANASLISLANLSTSSCVASSFLTKSSAFLIKSCSAFSCCSSSSYLSFLSNKFCASSFWPISCVLSTFLTSLILANASFNLLLTSSTLSCGCCSFTTVFACSIKSLSSANCSSVTSYFSGTSTIELAFIMFSNKSFVSTGSTALGSFLLITTSLIVSFPASSYALIWNLFSPISNGTSISNSPSTPSSSSKLSQVLSILWSIDSLKYISK